MTISQSKLPYDDSALEPYMSAETLSYHYGKHHRGYVDKLNRLILGTPYAILPLEEIITEARKNAAIDILNNAAQVWNHQFLWECFSPNSEVQANGRIKEMIERDFGDVVAFKEQFRDKAISHFGSGWVWLVQDGTKLSIVTTGNADSPVATHLTPLLTLDVWEHAYYLDYQNERDRYVDTFLEKLLNWKFAAANLVKADKKQAA